KEMRAQGVTATVVSGDAVDAPVMIAAAGAANAEGTLLVCSCVDAIGLGRPFVTAYQSRFGSTPGGYAGPAYDAANIFLSGLATGVSGRAAMIQYVHEYRGTGVAGSYQLTSSGDPDPSATRVRTFKVRNGQAEPVGAA